MRAARSRARNTGKVPPVVSKRVPFSSLSRIVFYAFVLHHGKKIGNGMAATLTGSRFHWQCPGSFQGDKGHPKILALTVVSRSVPDREWSPTRSPCDITSSRSRQRHHLPLSTLTRASSTSDSIIRSRTTPSRQAAARATSAVRFGKVGRVHGVVQHVRAYVATNNPEKQIAVSVATSSCRLTNTRG